MKKLLNLLLLSCALLSLPVASVTLTSCTATQQRIAYNSLYSTGVAVNAAYAGYNDAVVQGKASFSPNVAKSYNDFQAAFLVAVTAAQNNPKAVAPQNVVDLANAVYAAIQQFTKK